MDNIEELFNEIAETVTEDDTPEQTDTLDVAAMLTAIADKLDAIIDMITKDGADPAPDDTEREDEKE